MEIKLSKMQSDKERGQATLEFLVIAPLLFLMVALVAYAGWYSYTKMAAQNAAYSWMVFLPTQKYDSSGEYPEWLTSGFLAARHETLHEPTGMKEMWEDSSLQISKHSDYGASRLGGRSVTIWVFPGEIDFLKKYEVFSGEAEDLVPKGTAFFHYAPFINSMP
jgi:hypothetical protein